MAISHTGGAGGFGAAANSNWMPWVCSSASCAARSFASAPASIQL
jgi:hypothetical protein